jgi:hypothetical protein
MKKFFYFIALIALPFLAFSQFKEFPAANEMTGLAFNGVSIYPNPTNGQFKVLFVKNNYINASVVAYDNMGKMVYAKDHLNVNPVEIDMRDLNSGIYMLVFTAANRQEKTVQKVVIAKQ